MCIHINFEGIPEAVQSLLEREQVSESELADRIGVPQPVLNRIVRGAVIYPSLVTFKRLWPHIGEYLVAPPQNEAAPV